MAATGEHPYGFNVNMEKMIRLGPRNKMTPLAEVLGGMLRGHIVDHGLLVVKGWMYRPIDTPHVNVEVF